ncbi:hypothetical protein HDA40_004174 [Hamadaea flava]|uniref:Pentapeptide repeat-containing protein n=1 Tax=Hamadaea flava TaxID=1742688 RepID=A0ABV8LHC4_9ACTN|nr:pentapeptide repeat-containing protein [Hamadaea flava]MCP2325667.1 hypothetical protein [Hamadaea flava]
MLNWDMESAAVRLAGIYAMAGLADDWPSGRQTCIDVLCAYLRMPYQPDFQAQAAARTRWKEGEREVRLSIITVIRDHLRDHRGDQERMASTWQGRSMDFTGAVFDGGDFSHAVFAGGIVDFSRATFTGGNVRFGSATFSGARVRFSGATFSEGVVGFSRATFSGGVVDFDGASFSEGRVGFNAATFSGARVRFNAATFSGSLVGFPLAKFCGGEVEFSNASFAGGRVGFMRAIFDGGKVGFFGARFVGGTVDLSAVRPYNTPAMFSWATQPDGLRLPPEVDADRHDVHGDRARSMPGGAAEQAQRQTAEIP